MTIVHRCLDFERRTCGTAQRARELLPNLAVADEWVAHGALARAEVGCRSAVPLAERGVQVLPSARDARHEAPLEARHHGRLRPLDRAQKRTTVANCPRNAEHC